MRVHLDICNIVPCSFEICMFQFTICVIFCWFVRKYKSESTERIVDEIKDFGVQLRHVDIHNNSHIAFLMSKVVCLGAELIRNTISVLVAVLKGCKSSKNELSYHF